MILVYVLMLLFGLAAPAHGQIISGGISGTSNTLAKFTGSRVGDSSLVDDGTTIEWQGNRFWHDTGSSGGNVNLFFGENAGNYTLTGTPTTAFGQTALYALTSGTFNAAFGNTAGAACTTCSYSTFLGVHAGSLIQTGTRNTLVGLGTAETMTAATDITTVGMYAYVSYPGTGTSMDAFGSFAGRLVTSGTANSLFGQATMYSATALSNTVTLGVRTGFTETAANATITGTALSFIGVESGQALVATLDNAATFGYRSKVSTSNTTVLGNSATTKVLLGSETNSYVGMSRSSGALSLGAATTKPGQPTVALAGAGAGNVDNGTHVVCVTFITAAGETECSTSSASVNVTDNGVDGQVLVTAWTDSLYPGVTGVNVYMSAAGTTTPLKLVVASPVIANNTSSAAGYTINVSDANLLSTTAPTVNTAFDARLTIANAGPTRVTGLGIGAAGVADGIVFTDATLIRDAANVLALRNGATAQEVRLYGTYTDGSNYERLQILTQAGDTQIYQQQAGTGTARGLSIGTTGLQSIHFLTNNVNRWDIGSAGSLLAYTDNSFDIGGVTSFRPRSLYVAAPAVTSGSGTGLTVNVSSELRRVTHKVTVTYAALAAAGLTADKTIATLPAKTRLVGIVADTTTPYTGGGVTAATLIVGKSVGGNEYLVSHDVFTAVVTAGNADADLGASINRANAVQAGDLPSWSGTTEISVRLTTVTANTDQLTAGSTTYYITTERLP